MFDQAKNICIIRLSGIKNPSISDINHSIDDALKIFPNLIDKREALYNYLAATFSIFSDEYKILDIETGYAPWLKDSKSSIQWNYWNRYISFLQMKIAPDTINKLDNLTDDILDRITNPLTQGAWDKRGMVVGQVQSGKTSNYIGLINKAADSGYKLIIVLAGMHDSLRSQTQIRIDEGFLGRTTKDGLKNYMRSNLVGVGLYNNSLSPHSLTSSEFIGDFSRKNAETNRTSLRSTDPIIAVVKKNSSILKNVISWLSEWGEMQSDGKILIRNVPLLLIDDEADNASINVSKERVSSINGCIRALLSLFEQSAYVGYTATPFANVFIPMLKEESIKGLDITIRDYEFKIGQDLFPKDFIINIPAPSNYIGPSRIFGLPALSSAEIKEEPLPLTRIINDYLTIISNKHKRKDPLPEELPESLKYSIRCFIIAAAIRRTRGQINVHNSMLVHLTRFVNWQDRIATLVDDELKNCQRQIEMKSGTILQELKNIFESEFLPITKNILSKKLNNNDSEIILTDWSMVEEEVYPAISKMEVRAVHGDKRLEGLTHHNISPLDYFLYEQQGNYLSVIAVGGDKLSRGLTLEGLSVSYYLRASKMYDTLMQMGRWFGYRPGYLDLCRIFTSEELTRWYKHITIASEEMRRDFDYMFLLKKTPKDFGLKVRTHPGVLKITSANKFRYKKKMYLSYSGQLEQTYQFKIDNIRFKKNFESTNELIFSLGKPITSLFNGYNNKQKYVWSGENNFNSIISFLQKYQIGKEVIDTSKMVDYILAQTKKGYLVNWTVALINNSTAKQEDEYFFNGIFENVGLIDRTNIGNDPSDYEVTKFNITDIKHEAIDLNDVEIEEALIQTKTDYINEKKVEVPLFPSRKRIKWIRRSTNGLLLIYPLNHNCYHLSEDINVQKKARKKISDTPIIGIAVSFPEIEKDEKIEYAVNQQFIKEYDYPIDLDKEDENNETD